MAIKHYKPTTNGRRNMTTMDYSELSKAIEAAETAESTAS